MAKYTRKILLLQLEAVFITGVLVLSVTDVPVMSTGMFIMLGLAAFRMARTISFNEVGEPMRAPFTVVQPDSCGAGENVHPNNKSVAHNVIGSLLACPICTGTWSALGLYGLWVFFPDFGKTLITVLAVAGVAEVLHWGSEVLEWSGRAARCVSGLISPDKK